MNKVLIAKTDAFGDSIVLSLDHIESVFPSEDCRGLSVIRTSSGKEFYFKENIDQLIEHLRDVIRQLP